MGPGNGQRRLLGAGGAAALGGTLRGADSADASHADAEVGAVVSHVLNHGLAFASRRPRRHASARFAAVAIAGTILNGALFALRHSGLDLQCLVAQVAATLIVLGITYLAYRAWTF